MLHSRLLSNNKAKFHLSGMSTCSLDIKTFVHSPHVLSSHMEPAVALVNI